jgi:cytochrome c-type biogenesis protein CcmH
MATRLRASGLHAFYWDKEPGVCAAAAAKPLPDVNTMIERLAARLETTPDDIKGWQMLGWSYLSTAHYEQAATAYAKALALDPNSAELKLSYEEAKAKASESDNSETASSLHRPWQGW